MSVCFSMSRAIRLFGEGQMWTADGIRNLGSERWKDKTKLFQTGDGCCLRKKIKSQQTLLSVNCEKSTFNLNMFPNMPI